MLVTPSVEVRGITALKNWLVAFGFVLFFSVSADIWYSG